MTNKIQLVCGVEDRPPIYISLLFAVQYLMANVMSAIGVAYILHGLVCAKDNQLVFAELVSTALFQVGVSTLLQLTVGTRLPIIQGSSYTTIMPVGAMMSTSQWRCPVVCAPDYNETLSELASSFNATRDAGCEVEPWIPRINEISGSLACASLTEVILGCTGLMGCLMIYIGPFTMVPTITLVAFSMIKSAANTARHHWGITFMFIALYFLFALILRGVTIPLPKKNESGQTVKQPYPILRVFSALLATIITWLFCFILTITNVFPSDPNSPGYMARTDTKLEVTNAAKWFFFPYPGRTGIPTVGAGIYVGLLAAVLASIIESISTFYATANICQLPDPPKHSINRGVTIVGFSCILSGLLGTMHATVPYSSTVGDIAVTGVASRFCAQLAACLFILCGVFGKIGAFLSIIPDPIIAGAVIIVASAIFSVGLMPLKHIDLQSSRTILILGLSVIIGLVLPVYISQNPDAIKSGNSTLDQVTYVFLSTSMCVGGLLGFILDNIIPGTAEERGIVRIPEQTNNDTVGTRSRDKGDSYDLPYVTAWLKDTKCCTYVPFLPSFIEPPLYNCHSNCLTRTDVENAPARDVNPPAVIETTWL